VAELLRTDASVVACFATPQALDLFEAPSKEVMHCRVAPDEAMLLGEPGAAGEMVRAAGAALAEGDPDGLVLDATEGWAIWTLAGAGAFDAFRRCSAVDPAGRTYTAGDVARVPVRIVSLANRLDLLVAAMWGDHLRRRLLEACGSVDGAEGPRAVAWAMPGAG
jgi:hypothetical protein